MLKEKLIVQNMYFLPKGFPPKGDSIPLTCAQKDNNTEDKKSTIKKICTAAAIIGLIVAGIFVYKKFIKTPHKTAQTKNLPHVPKTAPKASEEALRKELDELNKKYEQLQAKLQEYENDDERLKEMQKKIALLKERLKQVQEELKFLES